MFILHDPVFLGMVRRNLERFGRSGVRTEWDVIHRRKREVLWSRFGLKNLWHDDGEEYIVKVAISEELTVPAAFYLGLDNRATPAEADNLTQANAAENAFSNGYARAQLNSDATDWTTSLATNIWQAASKQVTFTASGGDWSAVQNMFLTDKNIATTGKYLYCTQALSTSRTITDGDSLNCTITLNVREPTGE